jgi:hypothetical protein
LPKPAFDFDFDYSGEHLANRASHGKWLEVQSIPGRTYHLSIGGIGIGSLGIASVSLVGTASNLRAPGDIAGVYGAAGAGATFIGGAQVATLQNEKGVVLTLHGAQVGFQVSLGLAGMTIALR